METSGTILDGYDGTPVAIKRALVSIASGTTDGACVTAVSGKRIRVLSAVVVPGAAVTVVTFNTKPAGAGTAISAAMSLAASTAHNLILNPHGHFQTSSGEGLTITTSASGVATGVHITYIEASEP